MRCFIRLVSGDEPALARLPELEPVLEVESRFGSWSSEECSGSELPVSASFRGTGCWFPLCSRCDTFPCPSPSFCFFSFCCCSCSAALLADAIIESTDIREPREGDEARNFVSGSSDTERPSESDLGGRSTYRGLEPAGASRRPGESALAPSGSPRLPTIGNILVIGGAAV